MNTPAQIAKQIRTVYTGGNWTAVNIKDSLADITWQQATEKIASFNTIAALLYHMNYYVRAAISVLQGGNLDAHDKFSFDLPPVKSAQDWEQLVDTAFQDAETFAALVEQLPENKLPDNFADPKYGTYYRNITGVVEHCHYHLGQIVLLKKMLTAND
jgi:uncharacterized damage-inducible protein DinB